MLALPLDPDDVGDGERRGDQCEVDDHLDEAPAMHEERAQERRGVGVDRRAVDVGEVAAELEQEGKCDQHTREA